MTRPGRPRAAILTGHPLIREAMTAFDASGMTIHEVTQAAGIFPGCVVNWRHGRGTARLENFEAFVNALGYDLALVKRS